MSDDIDRAQDADAVNLADALEHQRIISATMQRLPAIGECYNPLCCEPFAANDNHKLFCGPSCAEEYERLSKLG